MTRLEQIQNKLLKKEASIFFFRGAHTDSGGESYAYISMDIDQIKNFHNLMRSSKIIDDYNQIGDVIIEGTGKVSKEIKQYMEDYFHAEHDKLDA